MMDYQEVLRRLAPCGLDCHRCAENGGGEIAGLSRDLLDRLGNYKRMAKLKAGDCRAFTRYDDFVEILNTFAGAQCGGCRSENNACPVECTVRLCHKNQGVDFCFQCVKFPCDRKFMNDSLRERWLHNNQRMKEIGPVRFYREQCREPRYR